MPDTAPQTKIDAMRRYGGEPVLVPVAELFRFLREQLWKQQPYAFIDPWIGRDVLTGHGSIGREIHEDLSDVDTVFVPVGGGGLISGVGHEIEALVGRLGVELPAAARKLGDVAGRDHVVGRVGAEVAVLDRVRRRLDSLDRFDRRPGPGGLAQLHSFAKARQRSGRITNNWTNVRASSHDVSGGPQRSKSPAASARSGAREGCHKNRQAAEAPALATRLI